MDHRIWSWNKCLFVLGDYGYRDFHKGGVINIARGRGGIKNSSA